MARNGQIYNLWTLNLKTHELKQYTDALTGNLSAVVLKDEGTPRIAFVTYLKGDYGLHILERKEEITTVASEDFGAPGPIVDFQAPLTMHTTPRPAPGPPLVIGTNTSMTSATPSTSS